MLSLGALSACGGGGGGGGGSTASPTTTPLTPPTTGPTIELNEAKKHDNLFVQSSKTPEGGTVTVTLSEFFEKLGTLDRV